MASRGEAVLRGIDRAGVGHVAAALIAAAAAVFAVSYLAGGFVPEGFPLAETPLQRAFRGFGGMFGLVVTFSLILFSVFVWWHYRTLGLALAVAALLWPVLSTTALQPFTAAVVEQSVLLAAAMRYAWNVAALVFIGREAAAGVYSHGRTGGSAGQRRRLLRLAQTLHTARHRLGGIRGLGLGVLVTGLVAAGLLLGEGVLAVDARTAYQWVPRLAVVLVVGLLWWMLRTTGLGLLLAYTAVPFASTVFRRIVSLPGVGTPILEFDDLTTAHFFLSGVEQLTRITLLVLAVVYLVKECRQGVYTLPAGTAAADGQGIERKS